MNEFKEKYKVERKKGGEIIITDRLKEMIVELLEGKIEKKNILELGIGDTQTIEILIERIVADDSGLQPLFESYCNRKRKNFNGYNFKAEAVDMLRNDYSQTYMAEQIGINRKSFSNKIVELREANKDNELGILLREHAERQMKKIEITPEEKIRINMMLDKYEEKSPIGIVRYKTKDSIEVRYSNLLKLIQTVDGLIKDGCTLKELDEKKIISESTYKKYKAEVENLKIIMERRNTENQTDNNEER